MNWVSKMGVAFTTPLMVSVMLHTGYDDMIEKHRGEVPLAFMRALAYNESGLNPSDINPESNATGLFQITSTALKGYNRAHNTNFTMADIRASAKGGIERNIEVAGWLLNFIIGDWKKHYALQPDWTNERFAALLASGYNAGYSNEAGIGYIVSHMESDNIPKEKITVDAVFQLAPILPRASKNFADRKRLLWAKKVANTFLKSRPQIVEALPPSTRIEQLPAHEITIGPIEIVSQQPKKSGMGWFWGLIGLGGVGLIISKKRKKVSHASRK